MSRLLPQTITSKKLLKIFTTAAIGVSFNTYANELNFNTNISFPADIQSVEVLRPTFNTSYRTLFFNGYKNNQQVSRYFLAQNFLGWTQHNFPVLDQYKADYKSIDGVVSAPQNKTVVLSHADNNYLISSTSDGRAWSTLRIVDNKMYDHLNNTSVSGMNAVVAYGSNHTNLLTSLDTSYWQQWAMPNSCQSSSNCGISNVFFGSLANKYALIQHKYDSKLDAVSYHLFTSTNLTDWYRSELPFNESTEARENVFGRSDLILISSITKDKGMRKLWWTPDLSNWASYELGLDGKIIDAKSYKNKIAILVEYQTHGLVCADGDCPPCPCEEHHKQPPQPTPPPLVTKTSLIVIDTESNTHTVLQKFDGKVTSLSSFDDKLFIAGDFTNGQDNKHAMLASANV